MPLTGDAKREYQRTKMRERRAKTKTGETHGDSEGASGEVDPGHEHYWLRKLGEETAVCTEFEFQGRMIGGCGQTQPYEGKLLGEPTLAQAIIESDHYKEIQQKMPVTKDRR